MKDMDALDDAVKRLLKIRRDHLLEENGTARQQVETIYLKKYKMRASLPVDDVDDRIFDVYEEFESDWQEQFVASREWCYEAIKKIAAASKLTPKQEKWMRAEVATRLENGRRTAHGTGWEETVATDFGHMGIKNLQRGVEVPNLSGHIDIVIPHCSPQLAVHCKVSLHERHRDTLHMANNNRQRRHFLVTLDDKISLNVFLECAFNKVTMVCPETMIAAFYKGLPNVISLAEFVKKYVKVTVTVRTTENIGNVLSGLPLQHLF